MIPSPGRNSRATTRDGSGCSRRRVGEARRHQRLALAPDAELASVLDSAESGERRLRAAVLVAAVALEPVEARAGPRSNIAAAASLSPRNQAHAVARPRASAVSGESDARAQASAIAATSIGCWSKDGPCSPVPARRCPVTERWPSRVSTVTQEPEEPRPVSTRPCRPRVTGGDQRLRQGRFA